MTWFFHLTHHYKHRGKVEKVLQKLSRSAYVYVLSLSSIVIFCSFV